MVGQEVNLVVRHTPWGDAIWGPASESFGWSVGAHSDALTSLWRERQACQAAEANLERADAEYARVVASRLVPVGAPYGVTPHEQLDWAVTRIRELDADVREQVTATRAAWIEGDKHANDALLYSAEALQMRARAEALEWAIVRTLYAGDIEPPNPAAPFWFREQLLRDAGLTMERCRELMDLHRGEDRVARL